MAWQMLAAAAVEVTVLHGIRQTTAAVAPLRNTLFVSPSNFSSSFI
jgi:hypothetical protein